VETARGQKPMITAFTCLSASGSCHEGYRLACRA
jgi:hypothetical protein